MTIIDMEQRRPRRHLDPEPWGGRMARARGAMTLRDVGYILKGLKGYSIGTINRLESLERAPEDELSRGRAWVLLTLYGIDPADLELGDHDQPPFLDPDAIAAAADRASDLGIHSSRCRLQYVTRPGDSLLRVA